LRIERGLGRLAGRELNRQGQLRVESVATVLGGELDTQVMPREVVKIIDGMLRESDEMLRLLFG
jgi:hypothetical protein